MVGDGGWCHGGSAVASLASDDCTAETPSEALLQDVSIQGGGKTPKWDQVFDVDRLCPL